MNKLMTLTLLLVTSAFALADEKSAHVMHEADVFVDGSAIDIDPDQLKRFTADLQSGQVAVVSVMGMVCDFCARGIEKTFKRDESVTKVDVDLSSGKVLIAFASTAPIDREAIDRKILANGQNVTAMQILSI
ncbi:MAG: cation transporter [Pseudomonadales bacterium]|nr:cation transporter [Pseudomonadales bacterium]